MTKLSNLTERVDQLGQGQELALTTEEGNAVRWFWLHLHLTSEEVEEYSKAEKRQEEICAAAGGVYLNAEQNREYMDLAGRQVELVHEIAMKRVAANDALRDRVWPELAPRVLRWEKLTEKPSEELTSDETKELETLLDWFSELQQQALGSENLQVKHLDRGY